MIELIFLGTSSGIPTRTRNVSALAIKPKNSKSWCLVDCGEATQHQLHHTSLSLVQLSTIFITHVHGDHCYGLPGLLASASMAGRTAPLTIVAPEKIETFVRSTLQLTDAHMSYELRFKNIVDYVSTDNQKTYTTAEFSVFAAELSHRVPSYAYVFDLLPQKPSLNIEKLERDGIPRGPLWGRIATENTIEFEDGRRISCADYYAEEGDPLRAIIGGDNDTPECLKKVAGSAHVLVHESTYTQEVSDRVGPGPQHSSAAQVAKFAQEENIPNVILTHFSARYHHPDTAKAESIQSVEDEAKRFYSGNLFLARDLDVYTLKRDMTLIKENSEDC